MVNLAPASIVGVRGGVLQRTRLWVELADQTVPTLQAATVGAAVADPTSPGGTLLPLSLGFSEAVGGASGGALSAADLQISLRPALAELVAVEAGTIDDYVDGVLGRRRRLQPADVAAAANHSLVLVVRCCAVVAADGADTKIDEEVWVAPRPGAVTDPAGNAAPAVEVLAGSWVGTKAGLGNDGGGGGTQAGEVESVAREEMGDEFPLIYLLLLLLIPCVCCCLLLLLCLLRKRRNKRPPAIQPIQGNDLLRMYLRQAMEQTEARKGDLGKEVLQPRSAALTLLTKVIDQAIAQKQTLSEAAADAIPTAPRCRPRSPPRSPTASKRSTARRPSRRRSSSHCSRRSRSTRRAAAPAPPPCRRSCCSKPSRAGTPTAPAPSATARRRRSGRRCWR